MKNIYKFCLLALLALVFSCDGKKVGGIWLTFDAAFPKANKNLENILGQNLRINRGSDTLHLKIASRKNNNLITDATSGDTLFNGKVSKYRGLYYFSQVAADSSYFVHAVKISGNLIYGLTDNYVQAENIYNSVLQGNSPELVKSISPDSSRVQLRMDKKKMRPLFADLVENSTPDTILTTQKKNVALMMISRIKEQENIDPEEYEILSKVYPNPAHEFITIDLQQPQLTNYQLIDLSGKIVKQGQLTTTSTRLDLATVASGIYALTLTNPKLQQQETIKIIKK